MQTRVSWNPYTATRTRTRVYVNAQLIPARQAGTGSPTLVITRPGIEQLTTTPNRHLTNTNTSVNFDGIVD